MASIRHVLGRGRRRLGSVLRHAGNILSPVRMEDQPRYQYEVVETHRQRLANKIALISGGAGSIGSALGLRLASEGAHVVLLGRTEETLVAARSSLIQAGVAASLVETAAADVTSEDSLRDVVDAIASKYGRIDFVINNAGASARGRVEPLQDQSLDVIRGVIDLNLVGAMLMTRLCIPHVPEHGRVIFFGSVIGIGGMKNYSEYAAAKAGISGLTKSLALELGSRGVTVNAVSPGWVWRNPFDGEQRRPTDRNALGRYGTAEEVAGLVAYLCSDEASYVTGQEIAVDGGRSLGLYGEL